ncbi:hypothetical protein AOQ84DRAFT_365090 [Glonium stellatum]|uniref:Uncharacterized protein n=1 Tax=Glonium stellatum TaxID=574774 RepID=A0A8E2EYM1_9PEZI|nr:hypothetical protein AOQ84DRAFT_365090 [Glonium stellatum]
MTLQGPLFGSVLSGQFGVNEIAPAITVGKFVGSLFTREKDSEIFQPLVKGYGIYLRRLSNYLYTDTLPDVKLDSVVGVATLLILILRYVEAAEDIVEDLQCLLKGEFGIIRGGRLEPTNSEPAMETLPFSIREPLRSYVRSVLDADADSPQHHRCIVWLSHLSLLVGNSRNLWSTSKYSRNDTADIAKGISVARTFQNPPSEIAKPRVTALHGGSAEISRIIARRLLCDRPAEDCLLLSGTRHILARKAAEGFHNVYKYKDYKTIDAKLAETSINPILVAFTIGCMKSLISNAPRKISTYAMTLGEGYGPDSGHLYFLNFCERLITTRNSLEELLYTASTIWGGLVPQMAFPKGRLLGIVCPEITILLDILYDPKSVAKNGLSKGIMGIYEGSVPILPQDPFHGAIMAGDVNLEHVYSTVDASKNKLPQSRSFRVQSPESNLIFTVEPFTRANGSLSAILCGWQAGDVAFQLNPYNFFHNLIYKRKLELADAEPRMRQSTHIARNLRIAESRDVVYINGAGLVYLQYLGPDGVVAIIDTGARLDWQVAAAGCVRPGDAIMVVEESDGNLLRGSEFDLMRVSARSCLIFCCGDWRPNDED